RRCWCRRQCWRRSWSRCWSRSCFRLPKAAGHCELAAARGLSRRGLAVCSTEAKICARTCTAATGDHVARQIELRAALRYFRERTWERRHPVCIAYARPLTFSRCALTADGGVRAPSNVVSDTINETPSDGCAQKRERDYSKKHSLGLAR